MKQPLFPIGKASLKCLTSAFQKADERHVAIAALAVTTMMLVLDRGLIQSFLFGLAVGNVFILLFNDRR